MMAEKNPPGLMGQRVVERLWQVGAGDVTGPFTKSRNRYEYMLVLKDLFSRWVKCSLMRKANLKLS